MAQMNEHSILASSMKAIFGALVNRRDDVRTDIADQKILGAVAGRTNIIKSKSALSLKANKTHASIMHYIQKAGNGTLSLHTLFPFQDTRFNRRGTGITTVNMFVSVCASSSPYEKSVPNKPDAPKSLAFGDGNIAALARLFASDRANGADIRSDFTEAYVPILNATWDSPYFEKHGDIQRTVGQAINLITLKFWLDIQNVQDNARLSDADREEQYSKMWTQYQAYTKLWAQKKYIDMSVVAYAKENAIKPDVAAYIGTTAAADEINPQKIIGTPEGLTSKEPQMNEGYFHAILLDDEVDEYGKHHFGIFKLATLTADNMETLTDSEEIAKTAEICSRSIMIFDGAGRQLKARARVSDKTYGSNTPPIKTSRSFHNLPTGSIVHIQGDVAFRTLKEGSQAIIVEIESEDYIPSGSNQNMVVGDITTSEVDLEAFTLSDPTAMLLNANEETPAATTQDVIPTNTQTDDEMNQ